MNSNEQWPFLWGKDVPGEDTVVEIHENIRYLFPEFSAPIEAPNLQKMVDNKIDYSVDASQLGVMNVVMSGRTFIDTLKRRGTDLDAVGQWSEKA